MNRYKKLASDTILMTIGNFSSKVLVFLLLPIYTYVLSTEEYGIADLFLTTVNLLVPILTISVTDATFRYAFDKSVDQEKNITNSVIVITGSVLFLLPVTWGLSLWNSNFSTYAIFFILLYYFNALHTCLGNYARGTDRIKAFVGSSLVYTILLLTLNILFLTVLRIGLYGYLISMISAHMGSTVFLLALLKGWRIVNIKKFDVPLLKEMLKFSIPMIFSTTAWWAMNSIDKYMLIDWFGIETSGLYGVAQKLPTIISVLSNIFVQAWQISAISAHGEKGSDEFYTNIYKVYETGLFIAAAVIIYLTKPLASIMFQKDYFSAFIFAPVLILSGVYSCLSMFLQSPFVAEKKSGALLKTTLIGLVFNIIANIVFLKMMGPIGATYATMIGFGITWAMRLYMSRQFIKIKLSGGNSVAIMILLFIEALLISYDVSHGMIIAFVLTITIIMMRFSTIKVFLYGATKIAKRIVKRN